MAAELVDFIGIQSRPLRRLLDQPLRGRRAEIAIDRLALINGTEQPRDLGTLQIEPRLQKVSRPKRCEGDAAFTEGIRLASPDQDAERTVGALLHVFVAKCHQFGAAREEFVAEGQHRPIPKSARRVGLGLEDEVRPCGWTD